MAKLSNEKIQEILDAYKQDPVYSHVAKKCGVGAATVKKYVTGEMPAPSSNAKAKSRKDPDRIDFETLSQEQKEKEITPLPADQIEIPKDGFGSWALLNDAEREAMNLGVFRK